MLAAPTFEGPVPIENTAFRRVCPQNLNRHFLRPVSSKNTSPHKACPRISKRLARSVPKTPIHRFAGPLKNTLTLQGLSLKLPTHQGTPAQTSTPRMGVQPSYWSFKDGDRTRIKPRHRNCTHCLRHASGDPPAFKRKGVQDSFCMARFLIETLITAKHLLRQRKSRDRP